MPPNPYQPPIGIDVKPIRARDFLRKVIAAVIFLVGLGVFGVGVFGTWMTMKNVLSNVSVERWPLMVAVSAMYLAFGVSFFASSRCILLRRTRFGLFFFFVPLVVFAMLLALFGA
ncbi:MAG: hypothetical protein ABL921_22560 [Pirellula sp.]